MSGKGYLPDELLHPKDVEYGVPHRQMIGAPVPNGNLPVQEDHNALVDVIGINDQSDAESCTGWEFAESFGMGLLGQGYTEDPKFDGGWCYTAGRSQGRVLAGMPLQTPLDDAGCSPTLVVDGCRKAGVPTLAAHPYDASKMQGAELDLAGAVDGVPRARLIIDAYSTIEEAPGPALDQAIKQALVSGPGRRVSLAIYASPEFKAASGSRVLSAYPGAGTVNHMVGCCSFFTVVAVDSGVATLSNTIKIVAPNAKVGDVLYLVPNHWGVRWAPANPMGPGRVLVDSSFIYQAAFFGLVDVKVAT